MNLKWNPVERRFEVEFSDFPDEQPRVKKAGFKTDGPPTWAWFSYKAAPLAKLQEDRPAILTITPEARVEFNTLRAVELKNLETEALLKKAQKEAKKVEMPEEYTASTSFTPAPDVPIQSLFKIAPPPAEKCIICEEPIYWYEYAPGGPLVCLWCQKIVLDKADEVC